MKPALTLAVVAMLVAAPVRAQEDDGAKSLMEKGMELFFEGLREEMSPALRDLQALGEQFGPAMSAFLAEMGPAFAEVLNEVRDWTAYDPPEILPNGDIIMRRKIPVPAEPIEKPAPSGPTDI